MKFETSRRQFLKTSAAAGLAFSTMAGFACTANNKANKKGMQLGLVTYQWGKDWDLPTLISKCEETGILGVELRCFHKHGVEVSLTSAERQDVKQRFADSPVTCVGYGSNQEFHSPDPAELQKQIDDSFALVKLCADIGAGGLKVKPNYLPPEVEPVKTMAQIAASLNKIGKFAQDYGQEIRVEVHGNLTQNPKVMRQIFDQVEEPNVKICWNCNGEDLDEPGLAYHFDLLKPDFGSTVHIREMDTDEYPYQELFNLFTAMDYNGWILLEARRELAEREKVPNMLKQVQFFNEMIQNANT